MRESCQGRTGHGIAREQRPRLAWPASGPGRWPRIVSRRLFATSKFAGDSPASRHPAPQGSDRRRLAAPPRPGRVRGELARGHVGRPPGVDSHAAGGESYAVRRSSRRRVLVTAPARDRPSTIGIRERGASSAAVPGLMVARRGVGPRAFGGLGHAENARARWPPRSIRPARSLRRRCGQGHPSPPGCPGRSTRSSSGGGTGGSGALR